jgi:hypothetical protein
MICFDNVLEQMHDKETLAGADCIQPCKSLFNSPLRAQIMLCAMQQAVEP